MLRGVWEKRMSTICETEKYVEVSNRIALSDFRQENIAQCSPDEFVSDFCLDDLTRVERNALQNELTMAARIQQALLPERNFSCAGWDVSYHYAPAGLLSGDYCDLVESKSGFYFLLGDVSGKGVAASMLMSQLHGAFRSLADTEPPLDMMVQAANRLFSQHTLAGQFATLVVGRAERDGAVQFVSAGHLPFLHVSEGGVRSKYATSIPLGVFPGVQFPVRRFSVEVGDTLIIFSDGMTEALNSKGKEYGANRLKAVAARHSEAMPSEMISQCLSDQQDFTEGTRTADDLSLLVMKRTF
jgi:phosphoserine phosphatase RsbU/P